MVTDQDNKPQNGQPAGLEAVRATLERLGVPDNADWMALVLFARNLVTVMEVFTGDQKSELQTLILGQMSKRPLDHGHFLTIVHSIQTFLLDNTRVADLKSQLENERQGYSALYDEMTRVLADIRQTSEARESDIQRMGAHTEKTIAEAGTRTEVMQRFRGMITEMVSQAREEARSWQERARQMEHTANFDPLLSELFSRRALDAQLSMALERCRAENRPLSLMFLDVDRFKNINDTYGHQVGDGVLRVLAAILSAHAMRISGYAARFGGEELVVLCEGMNESVALAQADEIRRDVAHCPFVPHMAGEVEMPPLHVTVSIGVAQIGPGQSASDLILAADQAMYAAKSQGRNRVVAYSAIAGARSV